MAEDTMLTDAIELIRQGKKKQAKEMLTRLLKADQQNATYWVWMSVAVESNKERLYALQTALKADPESEAAKRGLVLLGAMTLDSDVQPFPLNKPRLWEEQLLEEDDEKPTGIKGLVGNPIVRLAGILVIIVGIIGFSIFGLSQRNTVIRRNTNTPGPSPTYTLTPTPLNYTPEPTQAFVGNAPLWTLLDATYTPTPLYVNTPRSIQSSDYGYAVDAARRDGDWDALISAMEQIATLEPESADPYYYIGEAYRSKEENSNALRAYNKSIEVDENFAPGYLGRALVLRYVNANANIIDDLDTAIELDPYFPAAYLARARYWFGEEEYEDALADLEYALQLSPNSPDVYLTYAEVYLAQGQFDDALVSTEKALELDITNLDTYLILGKLYAEADNPEKALDALEVYTSYVDDDPEAFNIMSDAYYQLGDYEKVVDTADAIIAIERRNGMAYYYRGLAYLELDEGEKAVEDLDLANTYLNRNFDASIAYAQAYAAVEKYGSCYLQVERTRPLVKTDYQQALIYFWRATCHEGREDFKAAFDDWRSLLEMPFSAEIGYLRAEGRQHLYALYTPTPTPTDGPSPTPTATRTPSPTRTPSETPQPATE
jgi:tetratricopeptide (TPR) repeat protein